MTVAKSHKLSLVLFLSSSHKGVLKDAQEKLNKSYDAPPETESQHEVKFKKNFQM